MENITHDYLERLKQTHPTLKLLNATNAPLLISFFWKVFIQPNRRSIPYSELISKLDDYLYHLQSTPQGPQYSRSAKAYIEEWSSPNCEFLRQYYTHQLDEPEVDLTPATEKAIEWILSLEQKQFIGAESRLLTLFQLLREIAQKTEQDPLIRIKELERQKIDIENEIKKIQSGTADAHDPRQIKERFLQSEETARRLLSDFRQVEHNFRTLDKQVRERIATSDEQKGKLLDVIFMEQDHIQESDQGKSFKAFWEFLMSPASQDELRKLITKTHDLKEIKELQPNPLLNDLDISLLTAGEKVYKTSVLLSEQLRKFLETHAYLENRRILEIIKNIEKQAVAVKSDPPHNKAFATLHDVSATIDLIMSRSLFTPKKKIIFSTNLTEGAAAISLNTVYEQLYVDENQLIANIQQLLLKKHQVSLKELIEVFPIQKGLEEVITYLSIASKTSHALINNDIVDCFVFAKKKIQMPQVIFMRPV